MIQSCRCVPDLGVWKFLHLPKNDPFFRPFTGSTGPCTGYTASSLQPHMHVHLPSEPVQWWRLAVRCGTPLPLKDPPFCPHFLHLAKNTEKQASLVVISGNLQLLLKCSVFQLCIQCLQLVFPWDIPSLATPLSLGGRSEVVTFLDGSIYPVPSSTTRPCDCPRSTS